VLGAIGLFVLGSPGIVIEVEKAMRKRK
jgi:hypothetical protein